MVWWRLVCCWVIFACGTKGLDYDMSMSEELAKNVCENVARYRNGQDFPVRLSDQFPHPVERAAAKNRAGQYKKSRCGRGRGCNKFEYRNVRGKYHNDQPGYRTVIGPESQLHFKTITREIWNDSMYIHVLGPKLSWPLALYACASQGLQLVDIDNGDELSAVNRLIFKTAIRQEPLQVWTGGHRFGGSDNFQALSWLISDLGIQEFFWELGQPDDVSGMEDCVELRNHDDTAKFRGNDIHCTKQQAFICQSMV